MSHRDTLRALTEARPTGLDPVTPPADPALIMAYPQEETVTRTARRPVGRLVLAAGLPAVALAVTGAILLNNGSGTGPAVVQPPASAPVSSAPAELPTDAGGVLLLAAQHSESAPATAGDYWVIRRGHGEGDRPAVEDEQWLAALPGLPSSGYFRGEGGSWTAHPMLGHTAANNFLLAGQPRTVAELAALPTDPAQLRRKLLTWYDGTDGEAEGGDVYLFHAGMGLVLDLPTPPRVRGAAYRMLAALPGMKSLGPVTDQRGRAGIAIALTRQGDFGKSQARLIVDRASGLALASESWVGGRVSSWTTLLGTRWADGPLPDASTLS
ncbi:CU044_5270 family protein [Catellatospora vulcania]|uniref:CU044_5270 family protein n=1 Tax=Catellatospora vulcania TaxID=1460450 RepID=UPI0012D3D1FD|nr:CU044_5270 family protein [Catellatospora vulcania]